MVQDGAWSTTLTDSPPFNLRPILSVKSSLEPITARITHHEHTTKDIDPLDRFSKILWSWNNCTDSLSRIEVI